MNVHYTVTGLSSSIITRTHAVQKNQYFTIEIMPTGLEQFHSFNITANNSIGNDTCTYHLIHGGMCDLAF